jgi:predicted TIM-barrel fold metal-dependent hydrolase
LYWIGPDKITFASVYALWHPKWLIEQFVDLQMPEDLVPEYGELTPEIKRKILGLNLAELYNLDVPADVPREAEQSAAEAAPAPPEGAPQPA